MALQKMGGAKAPKTASNPAAQAVVSSAGEGVNFFTPEFLSESFGIGTGKYACTFQWVKESPRMIKGKMQGIDRLALKITAYPLTGGEAKEQSLGLGKTAQKSLVPDATGKRLIPIAGAGPAEVPPSTNYGIFLSSVFDCDFPHNLNVNDLSTIDGVWMALASVDEPADRKGFAKADTGDGDKVDDGKKRKVLMCTEILEGGKPWEGGGGLPKGAVEPSKSNGGSKDVTHQAQNPATGAAAEAGSVTVGGFPMEDLLEAAQEGAEEILEANQQGCKKMLLTNGIFKHVTTNYGDEVSQAVGNAFFTTEEAMNGMLASLGYKCEGKDIVVL